MGIAADCIVLQKLMDIGAHKEKKYAQSHQE